MRHKTIITDQKGLMLAFFELTLAIWQVEQQLLVVSNRSYILACWKTLSLCWWHCLVALRTHICYRNVAHLWNKILKKTIRRAYSKRTTHPLQTLYMLILHCNRYCSNVDQKCISLDFKNYKTWFYIFIE